MSQTYKADGHYNSTIHIQHASRLVFPQLLTPSYLPGRDKSYLQKRKLGCGRSETQPGSVANLVLRNSEEEGRPLFPGFTLLCQFDCVMIMNLGALIRLFWTLLPLCWTFLPRLESGMMHMNILHGWDNSRQVMLTVLIWRIPSDM